MAVIAELLDKTWEQEGIQQVEFMRESGSTYRKGKIFRHNVKQCSKSHTAVIFHVDFNFYVDDEVVLFTSREQC